MLTKSTAGCRNRSQSVTQGGNQFWCCRVLWAGAHFRWSVARRVQALACLWEKHTSSVPMTERNKDPFSVAVLGWISKDDWYMCEGWTLFYTCGHIDCVLDCSSCSPHLSPTVNDQCIPKSRIKRRWAHTVQHLRGQIFHLTDFLIIKMEGGAAQVSSQHFWLHLSHQTVNGPFSQQSVLGTMAEKHRCI